MRWLALPTLLAVALVGGWAWINSVRETAKDLAVQDESSPEGSGLRDLRQLETELASNRQAVSALAAEVDNAAPTENAAPTDNAVAPATGGTRGSEIDRDAEWESLGRVKFSIPDYLVARAGSVEPELLFRHVDLNPRDLYITPSERDGIALFVANYQQRLEECDRLRKVIADKEFAALIAAGTALVESADVLSYDSYVQTLDAPAAERLKERRDRISKLAQQQRVQAYGPNPTPPVNVIARIEDPQIAFPGRKLAKWVIRDGRVFAAEMTQMPLTAKARGIRDHVVIEQSATLLSFFVARTALSETKRVGFLSKVRERLRGEDCE